MTSAHPPHDGDGFSGQEAGVADFVVNDAVKHLLLVVAGEGRLEELEDKRGPPRQRGAFMREWGGSGETHLSDKHLKDEDAEPPPVHGAGV